VGYDPVGVTGAVSGQSGLSGLPDEQRERRYWLLCGYSEAVAQISEERDVELDAGLHQAEQDIAGILACLTDGSAGYLALGDEGADVVFGAIGVERDLGAIENAQEFMLAAIQPGKQTRSMSGMPGQETLSSASRQT